MKKEIKMIICCFRVLFILWGIDWSDEKVRKDLERWKQIYKLNMKDWKAMAWLLQFKPEFRNLLFYRNNNRLFFKTWIKIFYKPMNTLFIESGEIGGGLFIQHGFATMIAAKSIGENCWINQQVTIGYNGKGEPPVIGDNVMITCGAKVLGSIKVGNHAVIGANAVVVRDVEEGAVMGGVPAKKAKIKLRRDAEEEKNMPEIVKHSLCTGCTACVSVCPTQCLKMDLDKYGFAYPKISNAENCVSCHKCEQVCPVLNIKEINSQVKVYAAFSQNEAIRTESSSGGIFSEVALKVLEDDGCVYGAAYMEDGTVKHICVEKSEQLGELRGAKYAQSDLDNCFSQIKYQLKSGKNVLFSGTSCQVEGLNAFLGKEYTNLLCIDFVCHGVPSPRVWVNYVRWRAEQDNKGILPKKINLRDKTTGWSRYQYSTVFEYEKKHFACLNSRNLFMKLFVGDYINRESCSNCSFKGFNRKSDITLGDFWGVWDIIPEMDDNKGTSLVMLNSEKGNEMWKKISEHILMQEVRLEQAVKQNPSLLVASPAKENRNDILKMAIQGKYDELEKMLLNQSQGKLGFMAKVKRKILGRG